MLVRIARSLSRLDGPGSFSCYHREPGLGLSIEVDGVGRCDIPVSNTQIAALIERASPSPFGYRNQTLYDTSVRDSWEIPGERVFLDPRQWAQRFERGLDMVCEALGFPPGAKVNPVLQKLLIYGAGQFFAPHRDSEKDPTMWGTLVVLLPSRYCGGEVLISHAGQHVRYDSSRDAEQGSVGFLGFYADCLHETKPVISGHRVALTYALNVGTSQAPPVASDGYLDLRQSVASYFERDPEWLVYLLDHEYSAQSIGWTRLKNSDRARADALREVADSLECDCFLALADVHESYRIGELGGRRGVPLDGYGELVERTVSFERWIESRGKPCVGTDASADEGSVVTTVESHQRVAYNRSVEPWTGNEGGYADQWYHQTALVVVPRGTVLHAEISRIEAVPERAGPARREAKAVVRRRRGKKSRDKA